MKTKKFRYLIVFCLTTLFCQAQIHDRIDIRSTDINVMKTQEFDQINWKFDYSLSTVGEPELPVYRVSYVLPIDAKVTGITFQSKEKQLYKQNVYIYPTQPPLPVGYNENISFTQPDKKVYESDLPYPGKLYDIESDEVIQGYHVVTLRIYPFEYLPKSRTLNYYPALDYTVEYESGSNISVIRPVTQSILRANLCEKFIKQFVKNVSDVDKFGSTVRSLSNGRTIVQQRTSGLRSQSLSILDEIPPDYIIITCDSLKSAFKPFADWKTKKGVFTVIETTEDINTGYSGSDMQEKIRNYLLAAYNKWGYGLFILLGGDISMIPSRMIQGVNTHSLSYPTDKYYSTSASWSMDTSHVFTGSSSQSYINFLGRLPVSNTKEIGIITSKIITYERANGLGDLKYLKNNLYADAYLEMDTLGHLYNFFHSLFKSSVSTYVPKSIINNKYICDNADCTGSVYKYNSHSEIHSTCSDTTVNGDVEFNRDNFLSCLSTGATLGVGKFHFIYHLDHGNNFTVSTSSHDKSQNINRADMDSLTNGPSWQIFMTGACNSANFQFDCFAKHYLMNPNGGGVTYIGNTDDGWQQEASGQLQYFLSTIYKTRRYDIGNAFQQTCINTSSEKWRLHLLGDPEMQVWTDVPKTLIAPVSPTSLQVGQRSINVNISNLQSGDTALICVEKGTEVYETLIAGANGIYTIPVDAETSGTMYVTVTSHNYFPVENTIQITASTTANPIISSVNFVDDNTNGSIGNGNGQNDAGETIRLQALLKNNGGSPADSLTAELSSTSGYIHLLDSICKGLSINPNDSVPAQFLYKIDSVAPEILSNDSIPVQFKLNIKDASNNTWTKTFNINVFATDLQQRNKVNINPYPIAANQIVTFNVELQNVGQAPTNGLKAVLTNNNAANIVSSCSSTEHNYPSIGKFETKTATAPFQFTTGSGYTSGTTLSFNLAVTDAYGKIKNCPFDLNKPDTVLGLQSFAKVREIDLTWKIPASGASGYNIYRCNVDSVTGNESGGYVRLNVTPVTLTFYNDADSLKPLTKYYYKVTAVSQSGMESAPDSILAWTSYTTTGLYPIVMGDLSGTFMESNFVAEDVNNDGKKEIFTSVAGSDGQGIGDLVALDWEGNELFHIKDNITIYSGFANLQTSIRAGMAIGDINQDGINEIVSVTRSREAGNVNNKIICHIAYGDRKPDTLWQVPVLRGYISGAILDNLDNSPDGSMEILTVPDGNTDSIYRAPQIYNAQGKLIQELSINGGAIPISGGDFTYASAAVADLDGDGDKEIIAGYTDGVYVWHHNGNPFGAKNPFFTLPGYCFDSSPVVCDINNDGKKEILLSAFLTNKPTSCRILSIDTTGAMLPGWDTTSLYNKYTSTANYSWATGLTKEISVGNLENNDSLEVVAVVATGINIWNNDGTLYDTIPVPGLESQARYPLLADIDGDNEAEIIVTSFTDKKIYGYKRSGAQVLGFPLQTDQSFGNATPVIADLDGDGKSEIAAGTTGDKKIYVWKTNGNPDRIEWGSARHDARNTGEYQKEVCQPTHILSNTAWNGSMNVCNNIIVEQGATLTLNSTCTLSMNESSMIIVRPGANLVIDGGKVLNANIKAMPKSSVTLKNNGYVKLRKNGEFNILLGATFDYQLGSVDITQ